MKWCGEGFSLVFVDDTTLFLGGQNKELPEVAEKMLKMMRMEVEEEGLELSLTEDSEEERRRKAMSLRHTVIWKIKFRNAAQEKEQALQTAWEHLEWICERE